MTDRGDILAQLRPSYLARLGVRVSDLREFARRLGKCGLPPQEREEVHRAAHSMASSAAIFGHAALSAAARAAEEIFEKPSADPGEQRALMARLLSEAERVLVSGSLLIQGGGQTRKS